jgi:hypothetical protein
MAVRPRYLPTHDVATGAERPRWRHDHDGSRLVCETWFAQVDRKSARPGEGNANESKLDAFGELEAYRTG